MKGKGLARFRFMLMEVFFFLLSADGERQEMII